MKITSTTFENNQEIPNKYTCQGEGINPSLEFIDVLAAAKSLALIMEDPDAPSEVFDHWVIWNIPPDTNKILEAIPPSGQYGLNSAGTKTYIGPCPPTGTHRYFFKLFALDVMLSSGKIVDKKTLIDAMKGHILDSAELVGLYAKI